MEFFGLEELVRKGLKEDGASEDLTSRACVPEGLQAAARLVLKQRGCIAGLRFIPQIFQWQDSKVTAEIFADEGERLEAGSVLAEIRGPARSILGAERVALNLLQHLCGIATLTAQCVAKVKGTGCKILDTRKTMVGLRSLQKYAVRMGGGTNHRLHLGDRVLIKSTHLALTGKEPRAALLECLQKAKEAQEWIEVEIGDPGLLEVAIGAGANAVLLDNMTPEEVLFCVRLNGKRIYLEASGGISVENVAEYAATGVDAVSMGALTHSAKALDISLRIQ